MGMSTEPPLQSNVTQDASAESEEYNKTTAIVFFVLILSMVLFGLLGNSLSLAVLLRKRFRRSSTGVFMITLAVTDNICVVLPFFESVLQSPLWLGVDVENVNTFMCLFYNYIVYWVPHVNVWCMVLISMERLAACYRPHKIKLTLTRRRALCVTLVMVAIFAVLNTHVFFMYHLVDDPEGQYCDVKPRHLLVATKQLPWVDLTVYSLLPASIITVCNICIIRIIRMADQARNTLTHEPAQQAGEISPETRRLVAMLLTITSVFVVTTMPLAIYYIVAHMWYGDDYAAAFGMDALAYQIAGTIDMVHHAANFLLYCISGSVFRREVVAMVRCRDAQDKSNGSSREVATIRSGTSNNGTHSNGSSSNGSSDDKGRI